MLPHSDLTWRREVLCFWASRKPLCWRRFLAPGSSSLLDGGAGQQQTRSPRGRPAQAAACRFQGWWGSVSPVLEMLPQTQIALGNAELASSVKDVVFVSL